MCTFVAFLNIFKNLSTWGVKSLNFGVENEILLHVCVCVCVCVGGGGIDCDQQI